MEPYSGSLFRKLEYRSRLRALSIGGPMQAAYFSEHPSELAPRIDDLKLLKKEIATSDLESYDREELLSEVESCAKSFPAGTGADADPFGPLKPTGRDVFVAAASAIAAAYAAWKGREWLERKAEDFCRRQAEYVAEELGRGR